MLTFFKKVGRKLFELFRWVQKCTDERRARFLYRGMVNHKEQEEDERPTS